MIEDTARVVAVDDHYAWVTTLSETGCQSCSVKGGCGQNILQLKARQRSGQLRVTNTMDVSIGDTVLVGIAENALLKASAMTYLIPLILMILCAGLVSSSPFSSDANTALAGASGLIFGLFIVKIISYKLSCNPAYHPQLLKKISC